jgi:hypothetical protein
MLSWAVSILAVLLATAVLALGRDGAAAPLALALVGLLITVRASLRRGIPPRAPIRSIGLLIGASSLGALAVISPAEPWIALSNALLPVVVIAAAINLALHRNGQAPSRQEWRLVLWTSVPSVVLASSLLTVVLGSAQMNQLQAPLLLQCVLAAAVPWVASGMPVTGITRPGTIATIVGAAFVFVAGLLTGVSPFVVAVLVWSAALGGLVVDSPVEPPDPGVRVPTSQAFGIIAVGWLLAVGCGFGAIALALSRVI